MANRVHQTRAAIWLALVFIAADFALAPIYFAQAQDGSIPPPRPNEPAADAPVAVPSADQPASQPVPTPAAAIPSSAPASTVAPAVVPATPESVTTQPAVLEPVDQVSAVPTTEPTIESDTQSTTTSLALVVVGGVASLGILAGFILRAMKKGTQNSRQDSCGHIKVQLDTKKAELNQATSELSFKEMLIAQLKEKLEETGKEKAREKVEDKILSHLGSGSLQKAVVRTEKGKETYDTVSENLEQAKRISDGLRGKHKQLTKEVSVLESAYRECMLGASSIASAGSVGGKLELDGGAGRATNVFVFHGTEGHPRENWFPWLKQNLEARGCSVWVPQFPSPPRLPAVAAEWFRVLKDYDQYLNENSILIGHSLGGVFILRLLERLPHPVKAVFLVCTPIGAKPILNYERDSSFSGFIFDWTMIKQKAKQFVVYNSDNDPYVGLSNSQNLAKELGVALTLVPNAGHFNTKAGYTKFPDLLEKVVALTS